MALATEKIGGASAKYFIKQQETLGNLTGYIEEMINGQKVIKVFCHEEESKQEFDKKNKNLCQDSTLANKYGNILMPAIMQLGNLQYVFIALIGGFMVLKGVGNLSVGIIVAFLTLSKTFCNPVSQIAQQVSMMAMALAGAERIFELIDEACVAAAKLTNAHEFISHLPDGYQTMLTQNGVGLSQGQRQLISIARAAVADPLVMILDEATSSIGTRTEALVQKGMDNLMKGRTVFVIAHRLSTVRNSDAIMVLEQGNIIERGTHEKLIEKKGVYYSLYTGAFELE